MVTDTDTEEVLQILGMLGPQRESVMEELEAILREMLAGIGLVLMPKRGQVKSAHRSQARQSYWMRTQHPNWEVQRDPDNENITRSEFVFTSHYSLRTLTFF
jgi:hypothetical protein